jgi:hypothetical protein
MVPVKDPAVLNPFAIQLVTFVPLQERVALPPGAMVWVAGVRVTVGTVGGVMGGGVVPVMRTDTVFIA